MDNWFYPHTLSVRSQSQAPILGSGYVGNPAPAAAVQVSCDFQKLTPGVAFQTYGIEALNPARIYVDESDLSKFPIGALVTFESLEYAVQNAMKREDGDADLAYCLVIVERIM